MKRLVRVRNRGRQRGLSLVELMVGIAVGLIIVAGAATMVGTQLSENRRLLLETQVQQDLRTSLDIMARELRRSGFLADSFAVNGVWLLDSGNAAVTPNAQGDVSTTSGSTAKVEFARQTPGTVPGPYGFPYSANNQELGYQRATVTNGSGQSVGVLRTKLGSTSVGADNWQELTDSNVVNVTAFSVTETAGPATRLMCPRVCPTTLDDSCWPTVQVRDLTISITAQPVSDPAISRTVIGRVRLRNDVVKYNVSATSVCPS